ncbi:hypothetical protein [Streptomyces violaceusniger]|uniref:Uncharacterized protein n=1 Tax=Streptomyces violaceusniger (strain Tu 4113) TaxID=653045 RepID=G2P7A9_STRV4|nr:hypothetical protein [Streptomyces violaceusniger]AEM87069.1 hypothetical protein Strvi_7734 [Streptomyces violaceusniger Tu 4113]
MSIILEKPALSEPGMVHINVPVPVNRDMLAYALADTDDGSWGPLDGLPVEFIRDYVGVTLAGRGMLMLDQYSHLVWRDTECDPSLRAYVESAFRAIDRAYPELAPAVTA